MPYRKFIGVSRGLGVVIIEGERSVLGVSLEHPIVTNRDIVAWLCESDALFPDYFGRTCLNSYSCHSASVFICHSIIP